MTALCSIPDCGKAVYGHKEWCRMHHARWMRHGDPNALRPMAGQDAAACEMDGCARPHKAYGLCSMHYRRRLRHGDPSKGRAPAKPRIERQICDVEACRRSVMQDGFCGPHHHRYLKFGDPLGKPEPRVAKRDYRYRRIRVPGHPLAGNSQGVILEHRLVLYNKIGLGDHHCYWCGAIVVWSSGSEAIQTLVVDHLDHNGRNNHPDNLVPSCNGCNGHRDKWNTWEPWEPGTPIRTEPWALDYCRHGVDALGTHRRLQALIAIGWSQAKLAGLLGLTPSRVGLVLRADRIRTDIAKRVRELFEDLKNLRPPSKHYRDRNASARARNRAQRKGWPPPRAWDGCDIDDPASGAKNSGTADCVKRAGAAGIPIERRAA